MIENKEQKLLRKLSECKNLIEGLKLENNKLKLELSDLKEKNKKLSLSSPLTEGLDVNQGGAAFSSADTASEQTEGLKEPMNCESNVEAARGKEALRIPYYLLNKLRPSFLREIMIKKKLTIQEMEASLESIAFDLKHDIIQPKGSLDHFLDTVIKPSSVYISTSYFKHLDGKASRKKTEDLLKEMDEKKKELTEYQETLESFYPDFEERRLLEPEYIEKFKPIISEKLNPSYEKGSPNYNLWVSSWLSSR